MSGKTDFIKLCLIGCAFWCVIITGSADEDTIELRLPPRPARIYTQAPVGVRVIRVRAIIAKDNWNGSLDDCEFRYQLKEQDDFDWFKIDECDGTIETTKLVEKNVGDYYHVTVIAGNNATKSVATAKLNIEVTNYNEKAPSLTHSHYSQEILDVAPIGTTLMALNGTAGNEGKSRKKLYYFIQNPSSSGLNPWLYPATKPLTINYTTGQIMVSTALFDLPESILFYIGVADNGSPQRSQTSKLTLYVRNMSAPRSLKVVSTSEKSIKICWSPPVLGSPDGYRITYNRRKARKAATLSSKGIANITVDDLYKNNEVYDGYGSQREKIKKMSGHSNYTNLTYCHSIEELQIFTLYIVKITGWSSKGHLSMTSPPLTVITKKRDCSDDLCNKGICQEKRSPPGYKCICMDGFTGQHCDTFDPCSSKGRPCKNGICKWSNESMPYCTCEDDYIGEQCQWINPCKDSVCQNGGSCTAINATYSCECPPLYTGSQCDIRLEDVHKLYASISAYCSIDITKHDFGKLTWPRTQVGKDIELDCMDDMEHNSDDFSQMKEQLFSKFNTTEERQAKRTCKKDQYGKPVWGEAIVDLCYASTEITTDKDLHSSRQYKDFFKNENLSHGVLKSAVDDMSNIVNKAFSSKRGRKIVKALSNMLKINKTKLRSSKDFRQSARRLLNVITSFTENVKLKVGEEFHVREEGISVSAKLFRKKDLPQEVFFTPDGEPESVGTRTFFKIPKSAVNTLSGEEIRFKFVSFMDDRLFVGKQSNKSTNMPVFSMTVGNDSIYNIDPPITYSILSHVDENSSATCVFWDDQDNSWSAVGMKTVVKLDGKVLCESNHLTAFSILLDPANTVIGEHSKILSVITYIGLAFSTLALVITVATFALFRYLSRDRSGMIVVNLSISLLLLNICFIFATVLPAIQGSCIFFAVLLHYFVGASFSWMLIEALNMHQLLVTVFPSVETHFLLKRLFYGWMCPFFFVGLALSWNHEVYTTERAEICVISSTIAPAVYYTTYLVPMVLILVVNCVVFGLVTRVLCQTRPESIMNKDSTNKFPSRKVPVTLAQIRGAVTVVALLGVTWVTGAFAVGSARILFQYLFCITTPLQGFVIFVVRVLQSAEARSSWYYFIVHGIRGRQNLPPSSLRTHSSCQNTSSLNTQSTSSTPPTSVFVSALRAARRLSSASSNYIARNKGSMRHKRRFSSPNLKDGKDELSTVEYKNKIKNGVNEYNINDGQQLPNNICSKKPLWEESKQIENNQLKTEINANETCSDQDESVRQQSKYGNCRDSFVIPEFEFKYENGLFSNDLSTEIFSNIPSIQKECEQNFYPEEKKVNSQNDDSRNNINVETLSPISNYQKIFLKAHSSNNLQNGIDEYKEFSTPMKSMSLYQIENLEKLMAAQSTIRSKLLRFSSENMLHKLQNNDNTPLLDHESYPKNEVETNFQEQNHSLNPD